MIKKIQLCFLGLAFGLGTSSAHADIEVGVVLSLTGFAASVGIPAKNTVDMWPKQIAGQKVNVTILDDTSDTTAATIAARKLTSESKVDVIVGPSVTPTALSALQVAGETGTPMITLAGSNAIVLPADGARRWAFKMPPSEEIQMKLIFDHMKKMGQTRLGIVAISNAYGQTFTDVVQRMAPAEMVPITGVERFAATDTSFVAQALKMIAGKPDAILIVAQGTPALLPQLALKDRNFAGTIYQTQSVANNDFLRVGGAAVNGTVLPVSPMLVAEQLPPSNAMKTVSVDYVSRYEALHGAGSRTLFGAMAWDAFLLLNEAVPVALKVAPAGTPDFRRALRDALERIRDMTLTEGVYTLSATDHNGADARSQVLVTISNQKWRLLP